jgi:uncharacterized protein (DUF302 family)
MTTDNYNRPAEGLATIQSEFGPKETMDRLEADIRAQGMRVFARINHAALAAEMSLILQPTELLLFGNPRAGTPLMQANQTMGIDLPLKMLVWQDAASRTWLTYNEPSWLAKRHDVGCGADRVVAPMSLALAAIAKKATEHAWTMDGQLDR